MMEPRKDICGASMGPQVFCGEPAITSPPEIGPLCAAHFVTWAADAMNTLKEKERARSQIIDKQEQQILTLKMQLEQNRIADLALKNSEAERKRFETAQETERRISEDYKTKWHVALEEIERLKAELSRHHLSKSYYNPDRMACEYR